MEAEKWKQINLTIFLKFCIVNFFNSVCLNSLAWFFFISIQSFIISFIQVTSSLLIVQPDLASTYSSFLKCLFCYQSSCATPHHSWKSCSHSPLDDAATDNQRVKIICTVSAHPVMACTSDAMDMSIQPSPPKERGMKWRARNKFYFLSQWSLTIHLKTHFPVADCVEPPPPKMEQGRNHVSCRMPRILYDNVNQALTVLREYKLKFTQPLCCLSHTKRSRES